MRRTRPGGPYSLTSPHVGGPVRAGEAEIASTREQHPALPGRAAGYLAVVLAAACAVLLPLALSGPAPQWPRVGLLALLHLCLESLAQGARTPCARFWRWLRGRPAEETPADPRGSGFFPVLFAGVLMLPPAAAALVALPGALLGPAAPPRGLRRVWNAAQLALAAAAAAEVFRLLGGSRLLLGTRFPGAALGALAAILTFCLVNGALVAGMVRLTCAGAGPGALRGLDRKSVV